MSHLMMCPQGHRWEAAVGGQAPAAVCPVCGTIVEPRSSGPVHATSGGGETKPSPPTAGSDTSAGLATPPLPAAAVPPERLARIGAAAELAPTMSQRSPATPAATDRPAIPGYELLELLGHGGMGVVFKARHLRLQRLVALKMIRAGAGARDEEVLRFRLEAEAVARLQHPNIVQIYEVGEQNGLPYCALELVEGGSLGQKLAGAPQPPHQAARLVETLARAVQYAHERGIVHRDLKPANVLLVRSDRVDAVRLGSSRSESGQYEPKITDFGLAKHLDDDTGQTRTGAILGTPSYMAPEQAAGQSKATGPAVDVYALGAVLYELVTGRPPFRGATVLETLDQVRGQDPVPPVTLQPRLPRDLQTICLKCLQKDPARRYASAGRLADDLRRWLNGEPIHARPVSAWEGAIKWARRRPALAALVLVSSLAALSLLGGAMWYNTRLRLARDRAEDDFQMARQAVDEMLTEVGDERLAYEPHMEQTRRVLLEKALKFYQAFLQEKGDDPSLWRDTAHAYQRLADILRLLGRYGPAEEAYGKAIALWEKLAAAQPRRSEDRHSLAGSYNWLGESLRLDNRGRDSRDAYLKALNLQEQLVAAFPDNPEYRKDSARTHYNLGILLKDSNRFAEARQQLDQAVALLRELARKFDGQPDYRQDLARGYLNLGSALRGTGRPDEARSAYRKAIKLLQTLQDQAPRRPDYRYELGAARNNLGNLLRSTRRLAPAEAEHQRALALLKKLVADFPSVRLYRKELAYAHNNLATVLAQRGQLSAAEADWQQARQQLEQLLQESPKAADYHGDLGMVLGNQGWVLTERQHWADARPLLEKAVAELTIGLKPNPRNPTYVQALGNDYQSLAETLVKLGAHAGAVEAAGALSRVGPGDSGRKEYFAACFIARCVPLARGDAALTPEKRESIARQYEDQAMGLLRQAVRDGFKDAAQVRKDQDTNLKPLARREDFRRLLADMEAK